MNVYVESNFILELAFLQEQSHSCENILVLCQRKEARLIVPTFCLAEPFDTLGRKLKNRHNLTVTLDYEWKQLARSAQKETQINTLQGAVEVLFQNNREEPQRLYEVLEKIVNIAEIIPLVPEVVTTAAQIRTTTTLSLQDSMVYASVLHHLRTSAGSPKCFLTTNSKDFNTPEIQTTLKDYQCKLLFSFEKGYNYIQSQI